MGLMKKAAKGTLAATTLGASVAVEKGMKGALSARGANLTREEEAAGALFVGMSHESGRNSKITLYSDRIERVKERARMSMSLARQDTEVIPIKAVSGVQAKKDGRIFTQVSVFASGNNIEFRFRHNDAQAFKDAVMALVVAPSEIVAVATTQAPPDPAEQIKRLAELRDAEVLTEAEFQAKKAELLAKM